MKLILVLVLAVLGAAGVGRCLSGAVHDDHERCRDDADRVPAVVSAIQDHDLHLEYQCRRHD
jgi:hypothetical protein